MNPKGRLNEADFNAIRNAIEAEEAINKKCIPFLEGRPQRDTVIGEDDILNLKIALETAKSFSAFLEMI